MAAMLLIFLFLISSVGAEDKSSMYQKPACGAISQTEACPLNHFPVCGSNGITYPNECALCVHRLQTNTDILIVKDGSC